MKILLEDGTYLFCNKERLKKFRKDNIFVWDFDKVLFKRTKTYIPFHLGEKLPLKKIVDKKLLKHYGIEFRESDILLTGRSSHQRNKILDILNRKGFNFQKVIFRPFLQRLSSFSLISQESYINYKVNEILKLYFEYNHNIVVIDDNEKLIKRLKKIGINCIYFNILYLFIDISDY